MTIRHGRSDAPHDRWHVQPDFDKAAPVIGRERPIPLAVRSLDIRHELISSSELFFGRHRSQHSDE
jgi:hypothetical protein